MTDMLKLPVFTALLMTETNTFAPIPTGHNAWAEWKPFRRNASLLSPQGWGGYLLGFRKLAEADGRPVIESITAYAEPAGPTVRSIYEAFREQIIEDLRAAGPVGIVILALHGAMIADGYEDCEGDLIAHVRDVVGPDVPIGVELDPHCHLTEKMVANADVIILMKEYPHTDFQDRAQELYSICARVAERSVRPVSAVFDCRMIGFFPTLKEPMASLVRLFREAEQEEGILSVSFAHGFPWGDQPESGSKLLVVANDDEELARKTAERLGHAVYERRDALLPQMPDIDDALREVVQLDGLVVLADTADNSGGGAPGDTTGMLRAMLEAKVGPAAFGMIYDPGAVRICEEAGEGGELILRIGGKLGPASGEGLDVAAHVVSLKKDHSQCNGAMPVGDVAWIRVGQIEIVLNTLRTQVLSPDLFTGLGIELDKKRIVAVKSSEHFREGFKNISCHIIPVATEGALQMNFAELRYRKKGDLRYHPRVPDPLAFDTDTPAGQTQ